MFRRAIYSTRHLEYRRYAFPREQKRLKWLQYYRRATCTRGTAKTYLRNRR